MGAFRFKSSLGNLAALDVAALRQIAPYSIREIQRRAAAHESLLDVPFFLGDWPSSKATVVSLLNDIEGGKLPLVVFEVRKKLNGDLYEEALTISDARKCLQTLREIALEQDMHAQLEEGHISSPEEYEPLPEDEA